MTVLQNPRHERFAQELTKGKCAVEAYGTAGYHSHRQNAARLMTNENIRWRVAELQSLAAINTRVTTESLICEAEEARLMAIANNNPTAMVAASTLKAKLTGMLVNRVEVGEHDEFAKMSEEELRRYIADAS